VAEKSSLDSRQYQRRGVPNIGSNSFTPASELEQDHDLSILVFSRNLSKPHKTGWYMLTPLIIQGLISSRFLFNLSTKSPMATNLAEILIWPKLTSLLR
jgi:hypothetical protein